MTSLTLSPSLQNRELFFLDDINGPSFQRSRGLGVGSASRPRPHKLTKASLSQTRCKHRCCPGASTLGLHYFVPSDAFYESESQGDVHLPYIASFFFALGNSKCYRNSGREMYEGLSCNYDAHVSGETLDPIAEPCPVPAPIAAQFLNQLASPWQYPPSYGK